MRNRSTSPFIIKLLNLARAGFLGSHIKCAPGPTQADQIGAVPAAIPRKSNLCVHRIFAPRGLTQTPTGSFVWHRGHPSPIRHGQVTHARHPFLAMSDQHKGTRHALHRMSVYETESFP